MDLSKMKPAPGSRKVSRRIGRGESSGAGKTSGRGGKGQTARTGGGVRAGFEGGQMPLYRRIPKWGFTSRKRVRGLNQYNVVNLSVLERLASASVIDLEALKKAGYATDTSQRAGVKILGGGILTKKVNVKVNAISQNAKAKIESLGGTVELLANS